jgi:hypothetical protein
MANWEKQVATHDISDLDRFYHLTDDITNSDPVGVYYVSFYYRTAFGYEGTTDWIEYRIQNYQPYDFTFTFEDGAPRSEFRGNNLGDEVPIIGQYEFSFYDYDMAEEWADDPDDMISIQFLVDDENLGPQWLDANVDWYNYDSNSHKYNYRFDLDIPINTTTGPWNQSYYQWRFSVNDSDNFVGNQPQFSYIEFNKTEFIISNKAPVLDHPIRALNDVLLEFNITDTEDTNPNDLSVVEVSIIGPAGATNLSLKDADVPYVSGRRVYTYKVNRTAVLGIYSISITANDTEGREVSYPGLTFTVLNNNPQIVGFNYTCADPSDYGWGGVTEGIYRNIDNATNEDPMLFTVNITDVEDSWIGDNATNGPSAGTDDDPYLLIYHEDPYSAVIDTRSDPLEPLNLTLQLLYPGNDSNGHIETWITQYQFNDTIGGYNYYAGELEFTVNITDSDGVKKGANINEDQQADIVMNNMVIRNYDLNATMAQINNTYHGIDMATPNWYYFRESYSKDDDINFYVFATDVEGIVEINIRIEPLRGYERYFDGEKIFIFRATGGRIWNNTLIDGVDAYICTISYDDFPSDTVALDWPRIIVTDTDHSFKDDTTHGKTFLDTEIIFTTIEFTDVSVEPPPPIMIYILVIIGVIGAVVIVVVGIVMYRKKSGWRKYL